MIVKAVAASAASFVAMHVCMAAGVNVLFTKDDVGVMEMRMSEIRSADPYGLHVRSGTMRLTGSAGAVDTPRPPMQMTGRNGKPVMVEHPRGTGTVRTCRDATVEIDVDEGKESLPLAFTGAGRVVKKGKGMLVIGPGDGLGAPSSLDLAEGDVIVRGGRVPAMSSIEAGTALSVDIDPTLPATTPEQMVASGIRMSKAWIGGNTFAKAGEGGLVAHGVAGNVRRLAVLSGVLRLTAPDAPSDDALRENLIVNPGFENRGAHWRKYVHDDGLTYDRQYSNPGFAYATDSWAFGYSVIDGLHCARLHNNGGAATTVDFPSAGRYRLTLHMRSRADMPAMPTMAFVTLANGKRLEIFRVEPPFMQNFLEYSFAFDMPEAGRRELAITGLGVDSGRRDEKGRVVADRSTMVDGVSLVKEPEPPKAAVSSRRILPLGVAVSVSEGAMLALDVPGTNIVSSLRLGNSRVSGAASSKTHPKYISGVGAIEVRPPSRTPVRLRR